MIGNEQKKKEKKLSNPLKNTRRREVQSEYTDERI